MVIAHNKQELIDRVIYQIQCDLEDKDTTSIEEMLWKLNEETLRAYLPEADPFI
jgi:hypothetical protein